MYRRYDVEVVGGDVFHIVLLAKSDFVESIDKTMSTTFGTGRRVEFTVDETSGLFIIHPDILVAPTKISTSIECARRGVLSERVKSFGGSSLPAVLGNLKHSFMEVQLFLLFIIFIPCRIDFLYSFLIHRRS